MGSPWAEIICIYTLFSPYAWAVISITTATGATSKVKRPMLKAYKVPILTILGYLKLKPEFLDAKSQKRQKAFDQIQYLFLIIIHRKWEERGILSNRIWASMRNLKLTWYFLFFPIIRNIDICYPHFNSMYQSLYHFMKINKI